MVYNIILKVMNDPKGRFKKGRNHRCWEDVDSYLKYLFKSMRYGESLLIAYEVENIYSGLTIPYVMGRFILDKREGTAYTDGDFKEWVCLHSDNADYGDYIRRCA